jgi:hypothetical protein
LLFSWQHSRHFFPLFLPGVWPKPRDFPVSFFDSAAAPAFFLVFFDNCHIASFRAEVNVAPFSPGNQDSDGKS